MTFPCNDPSNLLSSRAAEIDRLMAQSVANQQQLAMKDARSPDQPELRRVHQEFGGPQSIMNNFDFRALNGSDICDLPTNTKGISTASPNRRPC